MKTKDRESLIFWTTLALGVASITYLWSNAHTQERVERLSVQSPCPEYYEGYTYGWCARQGYGCDTPHPHDVICPPGASHLDGVSAGVEARLYVLGSGEPHGE